MHTRTTHHGLELTELGFGAAQGGNLYRESSDDEIFGALEAAWAGGVRYFDTAPHYGLGLSERRLGAFLRTKPRDAYVLSTKVGRLLREREGGAVRSDLEVGGFAIDSALERRWDLSADGIEASIEESLDRLGLDRIDIAYLHDPDDHEAEADASALPKLIELRESGVVRAVGLGMNQSAMPARLIRRHDIDLVMLAGRFTLLDQGALADLLPAAVERGVGIVIAGVYNSGLLSKPRANADSTLDYAQAPTESIERANAIAECCEEFGVALPEAALAYAARHPAVISVVVGARTAQQFTQNLERFSAAIPEQLWTELEHRFGTPTRFDTHFDTH